MCLSCNIGRKRFAESLDPAATKLIKLCHFLSIFEEEAGFQWQFYGGLSPSLACWQLWICPPNSFVSHQNVHGQEEHRCQQNREKTATHREHFDNTSYSHISQRRRRTHGTEIFPDNFAPSVTHGTSLCLASLLTHPCKAETFPETQHFKRPKNLWGVPAVNQESYLWSSNLSRATQLAR